MKRAVSRGRAVAAILLGLTGSALLILAVGGGGLGFAPDGNAARTQPFRGDHPEDALMFRRLQLQDENGRIPPDGLQRARAQMDAMLAAQQAKAKAAGKTADEMEVAALVPSSWTSLGPGNVGGRIRALVIDPANPSKMFAGSVGGGIWRTDNAGATWIPVNDFMANLAVSTLAINPANSNLLYAGTGEGFTNIDALQGAGLFESTNGGGTWNPLFSTDPAAIPASGCGSLGAVPCPSTWTFVNRVVVSPDGSTLLAATQDGAGGLQFGIQQSLDSGASWTTRLSTQVLDLRFNPTSSSWAVAGGLGTAHYSTDGGRCWDGRVWNGSACSGISLAATFNPPIANGGTLATNARVELAFAASASMPAAMATVYASVNQNNGELYRSTDGGRSYTRVNTGTNFFLGVGNQGWYDNTVWVNPLDPTFVVVGGIDLWRSTDSGQNFTKISAWQSAPASSAHADHHVIVSAPGFNNSTNRTVFFGNDGGVYRTTDIATVAATSGWTNLNNSLAITQFYGGAGNSDGVIVGGAQDNGNVRYTGNAQAWTPVANMGGDGGYVAADPGDANYFYGEYINLQIGRSANGGVSGTTISTGIPEANATGSNFIAPFILDPNQSTRLLAGGLRLWRTNNAKVPAPAEPTWSAIKEIGSGGGSGGIAISAIAVARGNSNFVVVGHNNGRIFLSTDGADPLPTWSRIDNLTPARFVTRIAIDETRTPAWIYATFGGFSADNVYRTQDLGATWADITGSGVSGLPDVPVRTLVINPVRASLIYAGTEVGVFASEDAGATWQLPQGGPANVSVDELFWNKGNLVAATHGRGMFRTVTPVYGSPVCIPPSGCTCFGLWTCPCTWNDNQIPGSNTDVAVFCPVTMNTSPTVRNLRVNDRLTMRGNLSVIGNLSNFGAIVSDVGLANLFIGAGTLSNYRGLNGPQTEGLIAISGPLDVTGSVSNGGTISLGASLSCGDLATGLGSTITTTTLSARGNLINFGAIEGTTLDLSGGVPAGQTNTLTGSGTWTFTNGNLGLSSPRSLTLTTDVALAIGDFSLGPFATLDLTNRTIAFSGAKLISNNATVLGTGRIVFSPTNGTSELAVSGPNTFSTGITIATGTVKVGGGGTINGPFIVNPGATATMPSTNLTFAKDITIHGVLKGLPTATLGVVRFNGTTFTNNGAVGPDLNFINFNSNRIALSQVIAGPGSWGAQTIQLIGTAPGSISLANDVTFAVNEVQVSNLNVAGHELTLFGSRLTGGPITGAGLIRIRPSGGSTLLGNSFGGAMSLSPALKIESGVATTLGLTIGGYLSVDPGSTLSLTAPQLFRVAGNLINNGTINAASGNPSLIFEGGTFSNAGSVAAGIGVAFLPAAGSPPEQNLGGAGTWGGTIAIAGNSVTILLNDVTYEGSNLSVTGRLDTGAFTLTLPCTTTWSGTGDATGNIRRISLAACPGAAIAYGNPFTTIAFTAGTPPTELTLQLALSAPPGFANALLRSYRITPFGGSAYTATLRLHYLDSELNGNTEDNLQLLRQDGAGWNLQGATSRSTTNNWVEYDGVTQFSPWALASVSAPPAPTTFANWQQGFFTAAELANPAISGDFADPNSNGFNNLLEYAFGLDPKGTAAVQQPFAGRDSTYFSLTYTRALAPTDLTLTIERSFNFLTWSTVIPTNLVLANDGITETVRAQIPILGADKMSLRLRVTR